VGAGNGIGVAEHVLGEPLAAEPPAEWLLTDGRGGFAMGASDGTRRRRYHGLLVAALAPPVRRIVALAGVVEQLETGGGLVDLSRHRFRDGVQEPTVAPVAFAVDRALRHVRWRWELDGGSIEKVVRLRRADECRARGGVEVTYELTGVAARGRLRLRPLVPLRDFHALPPGAPPGLEAIERGRDGVVVVREDEDAGPRLRLQASIAPADAGVAIWHREPETWHRFAYDEDRERGQDWLEDVASPGWWELRGSPSRGSVRWRLDATVGDHDRPPPPVETPVRVRTIHHPSRVLDDDRLAAAADQFVVQRADARSGSGTAGDDARASGAGTSIIAGYPWFSDWGRDALISLVGLLLVPPLDLRAAREVLETMAAHMRDGLVPNCFDDDGDGAVYHTADASLWYLVAVEAYRRRSGRGDIGRLLEACESIVAAYRAGTRFGIGVDDDGLVVAGDGGHPVTWMDAKRGGISFTPRIGKPVELSLLWHEGLRALARLSPRASLVAELEALADRAAASIRTRFWWEQRRCLHDCLESAPDGTWRPDGRLRPNQVFGASLAHSPLERTQQRFVVEAVRAHLLTPYGLRTLEPGHPEYRGRYEGDLMARDAAYHNGTVWPWLIGPYCEAVLRTEPDRQSARNHVNEAVAPLLATLDEGCIGQIAEVYDGDPPHRASGCPAQAWSIAEVRRIRGLLAAGM